MEELKRLSEKGGMTNVSYHCRLDFMTSTTTFQQNSCFTLHAIEVVFLFGHWL
jgi:hypothetical protein